MATATHTAAEILWSLSPAQRHKQERLYSGQQETVVLTVTVVPVGNSNSNILVV